jgi:hypothetical protein
LLSFQLNASGRAFDVDAFLAATSLCCNRVFRRGQGSYKSSGFSLVLGNSEQLTFDQQVDVALHFLDENRELLTRLKAWPGVDHAEILLTPELKLKPSVICTKSYTFPVALVQACAALGLELGTAVRLKWPERQE